MSRSPTTGRSSARFGYTVSSHLPLGSIVPAHILTDSGDGRWRYYAGDLADPESMQVSGGHSWVMHNADDKVIESGTRQTSAVGCNITEW